MTNSEQKIHITTEELYGQIRATQETLADLAYFLGLANQLRNRILSVDDNVWENGLRSTEDESSMITRDDLPYFFQGIRNANEYMVNLINAKTPPPNQLGLEFSDPHEESEVVNLYHP